MRVPVPAPGALLCRVTRMLRVRGCVAVAAIVAMSIVHPAGGATSSTVVGASVPTSTSLDLSGCSSGATLGLGTMTITSTATTGGSPCHIAFGSNATAKLLMYQRDRDGNAMTQVRTTLDTRSGVPSFRAVDAIDANDIWVGGNRVQSTDPIAFKHTTDGGTTWTDVTPCASMGTQIPYIVAWTATEVDTLTSNKLCRSTDTGATWSTITLPFSVGSRVFNVPGTDVLWATTTTSTKLMRSTDRGVTWTAITVPSTGTLASLVAWSANDVTAINTITAGDSLSRTGYSYTSHDGGTTWTTTTVDTIAVTTTPATTGNISLIDRAAGGRMIVMGSWSLGNQFKEYYSDDDGVTWTAMAQHPFTDRMRYISGTTWMGAGRMNTATVSNDNGITWHTTTIGGGSTEFNYAISQERGGSLVTVGDSASIYRSTTQAASWSAVSPVYTSYLAVVAFDSKHLAIVATDGSALTSNDSGVTLTAATGCGGSNFRDAVSTGPSSAVVVGGSGKICRTSDMGVTWTAVTSGTASTLTQVMRAPMTGLLIAHGSSTATFVQSSDDGATWQAMTLPVAGAVGLVAIDEDASTIAISRSAAGQVWVSTDSGASFTARDDGIASTLEALAVSPSGGRIIAGHYPTPADALNKLASSTDGGATWTAVSTAGGGGGEILGSKFTSDSRLWLLAGGKVVVSDDGGLTFTTVAQSAGYATDLEVLDANTVITSGIGKLLTTSVPTVAVPDVAGGTGLAPAAGAFGACLLATSGATPSWPSTGACAAADPTVWNGVPSDSSSPSAIVATTSGAGTGTADLVFGLHVSSSQNAGGYMAHVVYDVVAP